MRGTPDTPILLQESEPKTRARAFKRGDSGRILAKPGETRKTRKGDAMMHAGALWTTVGRWAADRGMGRQTVREYLMMDGSPIGRIVERYPDDGIQIREIKGVRVLVKRINGRNWVYLPQSLEADAIRGGRRIGKA